jgi:hypothetical protein
LGSFIAKNSVSLLLVFIFQVKVAKETDYSIDAKLMALD